jgi:hypothetical protein
LDADPPAQGSNLHAETQEAVNPMLSSRHE